MITLDVKENVEMFKTQFNKVSEALAYVFENNISIKRVNIYRNNVLFV